MPELPEVERARREAQHALGGKKIIAVAAANDPLVIAGVKPKAFAAALTGRKFIKAHRKGKQMWFEFDRRPWPTLHFGMTGRFHVYTEAGDRPRHWKVEFTAADGTRLAMSDPRRFGRIRLLEDPEHQPPVSTLGYDPLDSDVTWRTIYPLLHRRNAPLKSLLLEQSLFAGVGNWIADEVLYQSKLSPRRAGSSLSEAEVRTLWSATKRIVKSAVAVNADNERFPKHWLFHHRWGRRSKAVTARGQKIVHETIGGRTTAWVPEVQV
jgi:formamidopyrimidine-DNA glycosylase